MRPVARILTAVVIAASPAVLTAQGRTPGADPDRPAVGGGRMPVGWSVRADRADAALTGLRFRKAGTGWRVTAGPASILWRPVNTAAGTYTVSATFTQLKPSAHPEGYGLFVAGRRLEGDAIDYLYFLVRQDGRWLVTHRAGTETHTLIPWTGDAAVRTVGKGGKATNALAVRVGADSVRFVVNGTQVGALPATGGLNTTGIFGLRVNHNLDVQVSGFGRSGAKGR